MTLPGGAAAKLGHRYEKWWTLSELVRMLRGDTDSLRIEEPGLDGVEFVVKVGGQREYHQAKRSHPSGKWSMAMLASAGVLAHIGKLLIGHQSRFVFVSSSDARDLADLCEGAVDAKSFEEFKAQFLRAEPRANSYERVLKMWQCDGRVAWDVLRRIDVHTISERQLEDKVRWGLSALFLGEVDRLCAQLAAVVDNAVHGSIERDELLGRLGESGFFLRKVSGPRAAREAVVGATDRYLHGVRRSLIQGSLIARDKTAEIVERLTGGQPGDCVLTGQAGAGKTGCAIEIIEKLMDKGIQVLAFRLDRHMSATSTADLGKRLELEESPALVLSAASKADEAHAVLIVDQLDAVSAMSGRSSEAFDVVEQLLMEAKEASIGTVVVCRAFDWHNDHRLRSLIREDDVEIALGQLSLDEVVSVLAKEGLDARTFPNRQLELLRLPQNLSLFLGAKWTSSMTFSSVGDLLGRYWDEKRRLIEERAEGAADRWKDVIDTMCDTMSKTQQLSVPKERLDQFSPRYLHQFVSENVLVLDDNSYAFGHESFFDYCFARTFAIKEESLVTLLRSTEQHLFRRAQVRQVLAYLRESDFKRYAMELRSLVHDGGIRMHIKDLVFAWLADVHDPRDQEWDIWMDCAAPYLRSVEEGEICEERQAVCAWQRIYHASSWFEQFHRRGLISRWLEGAELSADLAANFLRLHQRWRPDETAEYLESVVRKCGAEWRQRLRTIVIDQDACYSRRYFDLFLRLLDDGILYSADDEPLGDLLSTVHQTFAWRRPDKAAWICEVIAHALRRHGRQLRSGTVTEAVKALWHSIWGEGRDAISKIAKHDRRTFVEHVLPAVMELDEATPKIGGELPVRNEISPYLFKDDRSIATACLESLAEALGYLASAGDDLRERIEMLARKKTHVANHLLLAIYRGGAVRYADEAMLAFVRQPWRFDCGYTDSRYWCAMEVLKTVTPHCNAANVAEAESAILNYVGPYEKSRDGVRHRGWGTYNLLSAIPPIFRSDQGSRRHLELERKFGKPAGEPKGILRGLVGSPIVAERVPKMNDEDLLRAIAFYSADRGTGAREGAVQLAREIAKGAEEDPGRFVDLCLELPRETSSVYFSELLRGLAKANVDESRRVVVCRRVFEYARNECGDEIVDLLAKANRPLSADALDLLAFLAADEEGDEDSPGFGGSYPESNIFAEGSRTTRGRAILAIGELIVEDGGYVPRLRSTLGDLVRVRSVGIAACVAFAVRAVAYHNVTFGIRLFRSMDFSEERLLATPHVREFIRENLRSGVAQFRIFIERMLRSKFPAVSRVGAQLGCMAALLEDDARNFAEEGRRGHRHQRLGSADVAAANVGDRTYRGWCEDTLKTYFVDDEDEVRDVAASCFRHIPEDSLAAYDDLIEAFCNSPAFKHNTFFLLNALEDARALLPGLTCLVCEMELASAEANTMIVGRLAFRLYQQHPNDRWTKRCLDLIDRLCLEPSVDASGAFEEFER